jgi:hypothetical protein
MPGFAHGAVPAVGKCYRLDIIVDDSIEAQPEIYIWKLAITRRCFRWVTRSLLA